MSAVLDPSTGELTPTIRHEAATMPGFTSNANWELAQRIGKAFAASDLVPQQYKGNVANCIVALEMANRMGASPLMVMQNLYLVHGNPGWSAKFLIACFNQCGRFSAMRYRWNADRTECRAWAVEKSTGEELIGPAVTMQMAKDEGWSTKSGSKWKTMPELMLMYRASAFLVRTYAPEISMGLRTDDEIMDVEEVRPVTSLQAVRSALTPTTLPPADDPSAGADPAPLIPRTYAEVADAIQKAKTPEALDLARSLIADVANADHQTELRAMLAKAAG